MVNETGASLTGGSPLEAVRSTPIATRVKRRLNHGKIATSFTKGVVVSGLKCGRGCSRLTIRPILVHSTYT